jgi:hypothetical protein
MAVVRITDSIRRQVAHNITALFVKRIEMKNQELHQLGVAEQVFADQVDPKEVELAKQLNSRTPWTYSISRLVVVTQYHRADGSEKTVSFTTPFLSEVLAPLRFHNNTTTMKNRLVPSMPAYAPCVAILKELDAIIEERESLLKSISTLLEECSTLRQVLERWPTAMDFMPEDVKLKHAEPTQRAPSVKKEISDVDEAAKTILMKARMLQS